MAPNQMVDKIADKDERLSFLESEDGTAMLEFILIAPALCYLIVGILFFRHHLDYAQDSVVLLNQRVFHYVIPSQARSVSDKASDADGFTPLIGIRYPIIAAGAMGGVNVLAIERYYGAGTPYERLNLRRNNYYTRYESPAAMPDDPWAHQLGVLGAYFGDRIGGGTYVAPDGLKSGWVDRYPFIADPWQRQFSKELDLVSFIPSRIVMTALGMMTWFGAFTNPVPRYDDREGDIGGSSNLLIGGGSCSKLRLTNETNGSTIWNIVK